MSANPADPALERLNYFNGQRLAASDFRAEQGYHMGMRRVLNHALYSPGIVTGLEVDRDPTNKHRVIVRRGLAFDNLGREIFLPEDVYVVAMGAPSSQKGVVFGNLLVISYREQRTHTVSDNCVTAAPCAPCSGDLAWGAPTRITAEVVFEFLDGWPSNDSGKIALAQIELSKSCEVQQILPGVRKYAMPVKPQQARGVSLEGEKDLDHSNPKILYFHVANGYPESVTLYLRGRHFSSLYYTELGKHSHTITIPTLHVVIDHGHTITSTFKTKAGQGTHRHSFYWDHGNWGAFDMEQPDTSQWLIKDENDNLGNPFIVSGAHQHDLEPIGVDPLVKTIDVPVTGTNSDAGVSDVSARNGTPALSLFNTLRIWLDGQPITEQICDQLEAKPGQAGKWKVVVGGDVRLNGTSLSTGDGTGEIDLLKLGLEIGLGQHKLEFRVPEPDTGGSLQYNLYVS
jgi:hypothetical protein